MKMYRNKEWLRHKYIDEKLSKSQICKLCGAGETVILKYLKRFNIPRRSTSEGIHLANGNHCNLTQGVINWINGELLGDGNLNSRCIYSARIGYSSKYLEYIQYVSDTLKLFGIEQAGKIYKRYDKKWGNCVYRYSSLSYPELLPIYKQWYPEGKKIIPRDIILTPLVCRQWYIGDGTLNHDKREGRKTSIKLATDGLPIIGVKLLVNKMINMGIKATRQPTYNKIYISTHSTKDFLKYIGMCPVKCYEYKWAY